MSVQYNMSSNCEVYVLIIVLPWASSSSRAGKESSIQVYITKTIKKNLTALIACVAIELMFI